MLESWLRREQRVAGRTGFAPQDNNVKNAWMETNAKKTLFIVTALTLAAAANAAQPAPSTGREVGTTFVCAPVNGGGTLIQDAPCPDSHRTVSSTRQPAWPKKKESVAVDFKALPTPAAAPLLEEKLVELKVKAEKGQYRVASTAAGTQVVFLVDTGASLTALPESSEAGKAVKCDERAGASTAGGKVVFCKGRLAELKLGPFILTGVEVGVLPDLDEPLLGMNVLGAFKMEQENGVMTLSRKPAAAQ